MKTLYIPFRMHDGSSLYERIMTAKGQWETRLKQSIPMTTFLAMIVNDWLDKEMFCNCPQFKTEEDRIKNAKIS